MRTIKFRAWNKNTKEMDIVSCMNGLLDQDDNEFKYVNRSGWEWKNIELMQFTGLLDKNGKEIYEGDIVLGRFILEEVEGYIYLQLTEKEKKEQAKIFVIEDIFYPYVHQIPEDIEVIGNVFQDAHLLKENKNDS